jgi:hypothetical protein
MEVIDAAQDQDETAPEGPRAPDGACLGGGKSSWSLSDVPRDLAAAEQGKYGVAAGTEHRVEHPRRRWRPEYKGVQAIKS